MCFSVFISLRQPEMRNTDVSERTCVSDSVLYNYTFTYSDACMQMLETLLHMKPTCLSICREPGGWSEAVGVWKGRGQGSGRGRWVGGSWSWKCVVSLQFGWCYFGWCWAIYLNSYQDVHILNFMPSLNLLIQSISSVWLATDQQICMSGLHIWCRNTQTDWSAFGSTQGRVLCQLSFDSHDTCFLIQCVLRFWLNGFFKFCINNCNFLFFL